MEREIFAVDEANKEAVNAADGNVAGFQIDFSIFVDFLIDF